MADKILALSCGHYLYTTGKRCDKSLDPNETREWVLNNRIGEKLTAILNRYEGIKILRLDDPSGKTGISIQQRAKLSNDAKADFYLAIHHNAGAKLTKAGGVVVYHYDLPKNREQARLLYNKVIAHNGLRGNRSNPVAVTLSLYEVCAPHADALLIENGFMDSRADTPIILTDEFAQQTAEGLAEFFVEYWNLKPKAVVETVPEAKEEDVQPEAKTEFPYKVKVTADALNVRKGPGTQYTKVYVISDHGVYTITEEQNGWGRLKSGLGWICLAYTKKM